MRISGGVRLRPDDDAVPRSFIICICDRRIIVIAWTERAPFTNFFTPLIPKSLDSRVLRFTVQWAIPLQ